MKKATTAAVLLIIVTVYFSSCNRQNPWAKQEQAEIYEYISGLADTFYYMMPSGLYVIPLVEGTGDAPVTGDTAVFKYVGKLLDGYVFDNYDVDTLNPMRYKIGSGKIIPGVEEGLKHIKPGGRARLLTPSSLAFGPTGVSSIIQGYTPLLWDVKMIEVIKP